MSKQLPDKKTEALKVYDADNDVYIESTPERQRWANEVQGAILFGTFISAIKLTEMINNRLYLDLGFISRDDYLENGFPLGRTQAFKLKKIATRFIEAMPDFQKNVFQLAEGENVQSTEQNPLKQLSMIGTEKLYELTRIDDDLFQNTIDAGTLKTADGRELTIDDIREMTSRQFATEIKELRGKFQNRLHVAEEENRTLRSEMASIRREFAKDAEKYERLKLVEEKYAGPANKLDDKKDNLLRAQEHLESFNRLMEAANIAEDDPEELIRLLQMIVKAEQTYTARIFTRYRQIIHDVLEQ